MGFNKIDYETLLLKCYYNSMGGIALTLLSADEDILGSKTTSSEECLECD